MQKIDKKASFSFEDTINVLGAQATIYINEKHSTISEKSLYGAGSLRIDTSVKVMLKQGRKTIELISFHNFDKQKIINVDEVNKCDSAFRKAMMREMCRSFIEKSLMDHVFHSTSEIERMNTQLSRYC
jgi:tRNA pseudouridine-54 N-methylase